ncbi:axoneme-associated protein mst101(2) [Drosophila santomea]|uniref:axoneme-associated protein mst101(2) n=1 Tax=Drosophila santomea TaxID=129105 RepID=UPI001952AA54|nr:axoneme-associated protein mst101(2) [Drosophila santomea]
MSKYPLRPFIQPVILRRLSDKPKLSNKPSNTPRPPKDPPDEGYQPTSVDHEGIDVAPFVRPSSFRQFSGPDEKLGPGAGKALPYKNSSYFGYHRFSFMELMVTTVELRDERRLDGGLQAAIEADEEPEGGEAQLETMKKLEGECDAILANQAKKAEEAKASAKEEKCLQAMSDEELKEWCKKKEEDIKKKEQEKKEDIKKKEQEKKEDIKKKEQEKKEATCAPKEKNIQDMSDEELKEWCKKKEEDIKKKEQEKKDATCAPKEKNIQDMNDEELKVWCQKKEEDIKKKEQQNKNEETKNCKEKEAAEKPKCETDENKKD